MCGLAQRTTDRPKAHVRNIRPLELQKNGEAMQRWVGHRTRCKDNNSRSQGWRHAARIEIQYLYYENKAQERCEAQEIVGVWRPRKL